VSYISNGTTTTQRHHRTKVVLSDAADIGEYLERAYGVSLRLREMGTRGRDEPLVHARVDAGPFAIDDVQLPGNVEFQPDPLGRVTAIWATGGRLEGHCEGVKGEASTGELTMVSQPDLPHFAHTEDLSVTSLLLDPAVVASVASGMPISQAPQPVRFDDFRPVSAASARLWMATVDYVKNSVLADDAMTTPLVVGHASRLLAAVTLSTFPASLKARESRFDRTDDRPILLRRAIDYMDSNVDADIALADIAEAIHVTPRAVQYMFRKHLDTTPLQYLRGVRLHRAHQDLIRGDRIHDTVTAVAARWGFMHSGRFAVMYRETYGQSPHTTLRG
jgi:AraC-like DNA-binding protein